MKLPFTDIFPNLGRIICVLWCDVVRKLGVCFLLICCSLFVASAAVTSGEESAVTNLLVPNAFAPAESPPSFQPNSQPSESSDAEFFSSDADYFNSFPALAQVVRTDIIAPLGDFPYSDRASRSFRFGSASGSRRWQAALADGTIIDTSFSSPFLDFNSVLNPGFFKTPWNVLHISVRLKVGDVVSPWELFNRPPTGELTIAVAEGIATAGTKLTVDYSKLSDENGDLGGLNRLVTSRNPTITWERRASDSATFVSVASAANLSVYTLGEGFSAGLISGQIPIYRAIGTYTDGMGFTNLFTATAAVISQAAASSINDVELTVTFSASLHNGYQDSSTFAGTAQITEGDSSGTFSYEWQGGVASGGFVKALGDSCPGGSGISADCYGLRSALSTLSSTPKWNIAHTHLRLQATYILGENQRVFYSLPRPVSQAATGGNPSIVHTDARYVTTGESLTVNIAVAAITDSNDRNQIGNSRTFTSYRWERKDNSSASFVSIATRTSSVYALQPTDFASVFFGDAVVYRVVATYLDDMGFSNPITATASVNLLGVQSAGAILEPNVLNVRGNPYSDKAQWESSSYGGTVTRFWLASTADGTITTLTIDSKNFDLISPLNPDSASPDKTWDIENISLRLHVNTQFQQFISKWYLVNQPPSGSLLISIANVTATVGTKITVDYSRLSDENGEVGGAEKPITTRQPMITWERKASSSAQFVSITSGTTLSVYTMSRSDIASFANGENLQYRAVGTYTDGMGFANTFTSGDAEAINPVPAQAATGEVSIPVNKYLRSSSFCRGAKSAAGLLPVFDTNANLQGLGEIDDLVARIGGVDFGVAICFGTQFSAIYLYNTTPANLTALPASLTFQANGNNHAGTKMVETGDLSGVTSYQLGQNSLGLAQTSPVVVGISGTDGFYTAAAPTDAITDANISTSANPYSDRAVWSLLPSLTGRTNFRWRGANASGAFSSILGTDTTFTLRSPLNVDTANPTSWDIVNVSMRLNATSPGNSDDIETIWYLLNQLPTGTLGIDVPAGALVAGTNITANFSALMDLNGDVGGTNKEVTNRTVSFTWEIKPNSAGAFNMIAGAALSTYAIKASDIAAEVTGSDSEFRAIGTYTDGMGFPNTFTVTGAVHLAPPPPLATGEVSIPANKHLASNRCFGFKSAAGLPSYFGTDNNFKDLGTIDNLIATIGGVDFAVAVCLGATFTQIYLYNNTPANVAALPNPVQFRINGVNYAGARANGLQSAAQGYNIVPAITSLGALQTSPITMGISGTDGFSAAPPPSINDVKATVIVSVHFDADDGIPRSDGYEWNSNFTSAFNVTEGALSGATRTFLWQRGSPPADNWEVAGLCGAQTSCSLGSSLAIRNGVLRGNGWDTSFSHLRLQVTYSAGGESKVFVSTPWQISQPPTAGGISINFADIEYTTNATLTANADASGVTDLNDGENNIGSGANIVTFPGAKIYNSFTWYRRAHDTASFVSITTGTSTTYVLQASDFADLVENQRPVYRLVGNYIDNIGFVNPFTATAAVNVKSVAVLVAGEGEVSIPANKHLASDLCFGSKSAAGLPAAFATDKFFTTLGTIDNLVARIGGVDFSVVNCFGAAFTQIILDNPTPALVTALPTSIPFQLNGIDYVGTKGSTSTAGGITYAIEPTATSLGALQTSPVIIGISGTDGFYTDAPPVTLPDGALASGANGFSADGRWGPIVAYRTGGVISWQAAKANGDIIDLPAFDSNLLVLQSTLNPVPGFEAEIWNVEHVSLRFSRTRTPVVFSPWVLISQPPTGNSSIDNPVPNAVVAGTNITANYSALIDDNGDSGGTNKQVTARTVSFTWEIKPNSAGAFNTIAGATLSTYAIKASDIAAEVTGSDSEFRAIGTYTDGMGFSNTFTVTRAVNLEAPTTPVQATPEDSINDGNVIANSAYSNNALWLPLRADIPKWQAINAGGVIVDLQANDASGYVLLSVDASNNNAWDIENVSLRANYGEGEVDTSDWYKISREPTGISTIDNPVPNAVTAGVILTANFSALMDLNGDTRNGANKEVTTRSVSFTWEIKPSPIGAFKTVTGMTTSVYVILATNIGAIRVGEDSEFRAIGTYIDGMGFSNTFTVTGAVNLTPAPPTSLSVVISLVANSQIGVDGNINATYAYNITVISGESRGTTLRQQWQKGNPPADDWEDYGAPCGTSAQCQNGSTAGLFMTNPVTNGWDTDFTHLRVKVGYRIFGAGQVAVDYFSAPAQVSFPASGQISLLFEEMEYTTAGGILTVNADPAGVTDVNNILTDPSQLGALFTYPNTPVYKSYTWYRKANSTASFVSITTTTEKEYALQNSDFADLVENSVPNREKPIFRVVGNYIDNFGFSNPITMEAAVNLQKPVAVVVLGTVRIAAINRNGYQTGSRVSALLEVTNGATGGTINYIWERGTADNVWDVVPIDESKANNQQFNRCFGGNNGIENHCFGIDSKLRNSSTGWNTEYTQLRAKAFYTTFGDNKTEFVSEPWLVAQPPTGNASLIVTTEEYIGNVPAITITRGDIADLNDLEPLRDATVESTLVTIIWERKSNTETTAAFTAILTSELGENSANFADYKIYTLQAADFEGLKGSQMPRYRAVVNYLDAMGFYQLLTAAEVALNIKETPPIADVLFADFTIAPTSDGNDGFVPNSKFEGTAMVTGVDSSSTYSADKSTFSAGTFTYQWQWGAGGIFVNATVETCRVQGTELYTVDNKCFGVASTLSQATFGAQGMPAEYTQIRLNAIYSLGGQTRTVSSVPWTVSQPATGGVTLLFADVIYFEAGLTLTIMADPADVTDPNTGSYPLVANHGVREFTSFQLLRQNTTTKDFEQINPFNSTATTYIFRQIDFDNVDNGEKTTLRIVANYVDDFGYQDLITANAEINLQVPSIDDIELTINVSNAVGNGYQPNSGLTASIEITDGFPGGTFTYEWQWGLSGGTFQSVTINTSTCTGTDEGRCFGFNSGLNTSSNQWDTDFTHLRLKATYSLGGNTKDFFSDEWQISQPATSSLKTIGFAEIAYNQVGGKLTVNLGTITDLNNLSQIGNSRTFSYHWSRKTNDSASFVSVTSGANASIYALQASDFENLVSGQRVGFSVVVTYLDDMGFSNLFTITTDVNIQPIGAVVGNVTYVTSPSQNYNNRAIVTATLRVDNEGSATVFAWQAAKANGDIVGVSSTGSSGTYNFLSPRDAGLVAGGQTGLWNLENVSLRASVTFTRIGGVQQIFLGPWIAMNQPVQGVAINFSDVAIISPNVATLTINISNAIDTNDGGNPSLSGEFTSFTWERKINNAATEFVSLTSGVNATLYVIQTIDFANIENTGTDRPIYRVLGYYRDGFGFTNVVAATITPDVRKRPEAVDGSLAIGRVGVIANLFFSALFTRTAGEEGTLTYQWQSSPDNTPANFTPISGATSGVYQIIPADWDPTNRYLRVQITHTDSAGFQTIFTAIGIVGYTPLSGGVIQIQPPSLNDTNFTASISGINGVASSTTYIWSARLRPGAAFVPVNAAGRTAQIYTLNAADFSGILNTDLTPALKVSAEILDPFGGTLNLEATFTIPRPPVGGLNIAIRSPSAIVNGASFSASASFVANAYQWQVANASGTFNNLSGATLSTFVLTESWDAANTQLRVQGVQRDPLGIAVTENSPAVQIEIPGVLQGEIIASNGENVGSEMTARITYTDANNGGGQVGRTLYIWSDRINGGGNVLQSGNRNVFVLGSPQQATSLFVQVIATDSLGYATTLNLRFVTDQRSSIASVQILPATSFANAAQFTARIEYTLNTGGDLTYQWQQGIGDTYSNIANTDNAIFILTSSLSSGAWNSANTHLRVIATHNGYNGNDLTLTATVEIAKDATVQNTFVLPEDVAGGARISVGNVIEASVAVTDANNGGSGRLNGQTIFMWKDSADGNLLTTGSVFTVLTAEEDATTYSVFLSLRVIDGLGYVTETEYPLVLGGASAEVLQSNVGNAINIFNVLAAQSAAGALGAHLDGVSSAGTGGGFISINDVPLNSAQDLAAALSHKKANSKHAGKNFGVDSFAIRQSGAAGSSAVSGQEWSTWLSGNAANIEGDPVFDGVKFTYKGDSSGIYGGADRQFGNLRAGVAVGQNIAEIDTDFTPEVDDGEIGTLSRELQILMPYLEWRNPESGSQFRAMIGSGRGKVELREGGNSGCAANLDENLFFGRIGGVLAYNDSIWQKTLNGTFSYTNSRVQAGNCSATILLPQTNGNIGEWKLGAQIAYAPADAIFSPSFGLNARQTFGDQEDLAYDLFGRLLFGNANNLGLNAGAEGSLQFNEAAHRRNAISGWLIYRGGTIHSSVRTELNTAAILKHRWSLNYEDKQNQNQTSGEFYIETTPTKNSKTKIGTTIQIRF